MAIRYIGSKARLIESIRGHIGSPSSLDGRFVDAFCGTGVVAEAASYLGWPVWVNDHLVSAGILSAARLISVREACFEKLGGYEQVVGCLNSLEPVRGFVWREYSPASEELVGFQRRYFSEENAGRIDAVRLQISKWKRDGFVSGTEERLLIADLLEAANRVANTAGTYGCFLSTWMSQARSDISLRPRVLLPLSAKVRVTNWDVSSLKVRPNDLVYLDPPYTKRQYASYYHILETIAIGDEPIVSGVAGLRPWKSKASDYCYKTKALDAISSLVSNLPASRILLSYSEEGHVPIRDLCRNLRRVGSIKKYSLAQVGRYRPNKVASEAGSQVREYLIVVQKNKSSLVAKEVVNGRAKAF